MLEKLKTKKEQIDAIDTEELKPVDKKDVEDVIKLIEIAHATNATFKLKLILSIGEFIVDSDSYDGIKFVNSKKDGDKLLVKYKNLLLSYDTSIELEHIKCIDFSLKYGTGE